MLAKKYINVDKIRERIDSNTCKKMSKRNNTNSPSVPLILIEKFCKYDESKIVLTDKSILKSVEDGKTLESRYRKRTLESAICFTEEIHENESNKIIRKVKRKRRKHKRDKAKIKSMNVQNEMDKTKLNEFNTADSCLKDMTQEKVKKKNKARVADASNHFDYMPDNSHYEFLRAPFTRHNHIYSSNGKDHNVCVKPSSRHASKCLVKGRIKHKNKEKMPHNFIQIENQNVDSNRKKPKYFDSEICNSGQSHMESFVNLTENNTRKSNYSINAEIEPKRKKVKCDDGRHKELMSENLPKSNKVAHGNLKNILKPESKIRRKRNLESVASSAEEINEKESKNIISEGGIPKRRKHSRSKLQDKLISTENEVNKKSRHSSMDITESWTIKKAMHVAQEKIIKKDKNTNIMTATKHCKDKDYEYILNKDNFKLKTVSVNQCKHRDSSNNKKHNGVKRSRNDLKYGIKDHIKDKNKKATSHCGINIKKQKMKNPGYSRSEISNSEQKNMEHLVIVAENCVNKNYSINEEIVPITKSKKVDSQQMEFTGELTKTSKVVAVPGIDDLNTTKQIQNNDAQFQKCLEPFENESKNLISGVKRKRKCRHRSRAKLLSMCNEFQQMEFAGELPKTIKVVAVPGIDDLNTTKQIQNNDAQFQKCLESVYFTKEFYENKSKNLISDVKRKRKKKRKRRSRAKSMGMYNEFGEDMYADIKDSCITDKVSKCKSQENMNKMNNTMNTAESNHYRNKDLDYIQDYEVTKPARKGSCKTCSYTEDASVKPHRPGCKAKSHKCKKDLPFDKEFKNPKLGNKKTNYFDSVISGDEQNFNAKLDKKNILESYYSVHLDSVFDGLSFSDDSSLNNSIASKEVENSKVQLSKNVSAQRNKDDYTNNRENHKDMSQDVNTFMTTIKSENLADNQLMNLDKENKDDYTNNKENHKDMLQDVNTFMTTIKSENFADNQLMNLDNRVSKDRNQEMYDRHRLIFPKESSSLTKEGNQNSEGESQGGISTANQEYLWNSETVDADNGGVYWLESGESNDSHPIGYSHKNNSVGHIPLTIDADIDVTNSSSKRSVVCMHSKTPSQHTVSAPEDAKVECLRTINYMKSISGTSYSEVTTVDDASLHHQSNSGSIKEVRDETMNLKSNNLTLDKGTLLANDTFQSNSNLPFSNDSLLSKDLTIQRDCTSESDEDIVLLSDDILLQGGNINSMELLPRAEKVTFLNINERITIKNKPVNNKRILTKYVSQNSTKERPAVIIDKQMHIYRNSTDGTCFGIFPVQLTKDEEILEIEMYDPFPMGDGFLSKNTYHLKKVDSVSLQFNVQPSINIKCEKESTAQNSSTRIAKPYPANVKCEKESNVKCENESNVTCENESNVTCEKESNVKCENESSVKCENESNVTCENESNVTCENESNIKCEKESSVTYENKSNVTCEKESNVKCENNSRVKRKKESNVKCEKESNVKREKESSVKCENDTAGNNTGSNAIKSVVHSFEKNKYMITRSFNKTESSEKWRPTTQTKLDSYLKPKRH